MSDGMPVVRGGEAHERRRHRREMFRVGAFHVEVAEPFRKGLRLALRFRCRENLGRARPARFVRVVLHGGTQPLQESADVDVAVSVRVHVRVCFLFL